MCVWTKKQLKIPTLWVTPSRSFLHSTNAQTYREITFFFAFSIIFSYYLLLTLRTLRANITDTVYYKFSSFVYFHLLTFRCSCVCVQCVAKGNFHLFSAFLLVCRSAEERKMSARVREDHGTHTHANRACRVCAIFCFSLVSVAKNLGESLRVFIF